MFVEGAEPGEADNEPPSDSSTEGSDDEEDVEYDAAEKAQDEVLDRWSGGYYTETEAIWSCDQRTYGTI